ncbi:hypothetical protein EV2_003661 [Malus domestica]
MPRQLNLSTYSVLFLSENTFSIKSPKMMSSFPQPETHFDKNNLHQHQDLILFPSKAKVSYIIKIESKSISYHAISLSFPLPLLLSAKQGERKRSVET